MIVMRPIIFALLLFLVAGPAAADTTYDFVYAGRLTDSSGKPFDGPVALSITFYHDPSGAVPILTVTRDLMAVPLQQGVFQVKITLPASDYGAVFSDASKPVYIQVTDLTHSPTSPYPLQQISAVPYAAKIPVDGKTLSFNSAGQLSVMPQTLAQSGQFLTQDSDGNFTWATPLSSATSLQGQPLSSSVVPAAGQVLEFDGTQWVPSAISGGSGGTVTSVGVTAPLAVTSPTTTPQLSITQATSVASGYLSSSDWLSFSGTATTVGAAASANTVSTLVKRDASGDFAAGTITATLNGTANNVSGTVALANGGTGATTAAAARTNLGLGSAATLTAGAAANNVVQLDGSAKLPAVDGSQLTNVSASSTIGLPVNSGTAGSVLFVDAASKLGQNNSKFFWDNTNNRLGIGTASPSTAAEISSVGGTELTITSDSSEVVPKDAFTTFRDASSTAWTVGKIGGGTGTYNDFAIRRFASGSYADTPLTITSTNGNVGVDTQVPVEKLEIVGNVKSGEAPATLTTLSAAMLSTDTTATVVSTAGYPSAGTLLIGAEAMQYKGVTATTFTGLTRGVLGTTAAAQSSGAQVNNYLNTVVATATAPKLVVNGNGNVGIGTATPTQSLEVNGNARVNGGLEVPETTGYAVLSNDLAAANSYLTAGTDPDADTLVIGKLTDGDVAMGQYGYGTGGFAGVITDNSYVSYYGFTYRPDDPITTGWFSGLKVRDDESWLYAAGIIAADFATDYVSLRTNDADRLTIRSDGKVGIGTITPSNTLQVIGSVCVKASGTCAGSTGGTIYVTNAVSTGADLAEHMPTGDRVLAVGDVVAIAAGGASDEATFDRSKTAYQANAIGVVSTAPGVSLGSDTKASRPVALAGRVPVNVTLEGGPIAIGDYLVASSSPGKAMKAKDLTRGGIIGIALSAYDGTPILAKDWGDGVAHEQGRQVLMLVQPGAGSQAGVAALQAASQTKDKEIFQLQTAAVQLKVDAAKKDVEIGQLRSYICAKDASASFCAHDAP